MSLSSRRVIRKLKAAGFVEVRQRGDHVQFRKPGQPGLVTVPHPQHDLPIGTIKSIEKQSGISLR